MSVESERAGAERRGGAGEDVLPGALRGDDGESARLEVGEEFGFFLRDAFERAEEFEVAVRDGDDDREVGHGAVGERFEFAVMVGPGLQDGDAVARVEAEQILRQPDLVVGVALGRQHADGVHRVLEDRPQGFLRAGLAAGAGQQDDLQVREAHAVEPGDALERRHGRGDDDRRNAGRELFEFRFLDAEERCAVRDGLREVVVSVELFAGEREEEGVAGGFAGVGEDGVDHCGRVVADEAAFRGAEQFMERE